MPPLGIMYLAAWLRKYGHDPDILDLAGVQDWKTEVLVNTRVFHRIGRKLDWQCVFF
jgi:hypothetical protein